MLYLVLKNRNILLALALDEQASNLQQKEFLEKLLSEDKYGFGCGCGVWRILVSFLISCF